MIVLADTNILVRLFNETDAQHPVAVAALEKLAKLDSDVWLTPQNVIEFWNTATRPLDRNGLGMRPAEAKEIILKIEATYRLLPEGPRVYTVWKSLASKYSVSGTKVHDTRLVASALVHSVTTILTFNTADFRRYSEIEVLDPKSI